MKIKTLEQIQKLVNEDPELKKKISSVEIGETNDDGSLVVITWFKLPYYNTGSMSGYIHSETIGEWKNDMKHIKRIKSKKDLDNPQLDMSTQNYEETVKQPEIGCWEKDRFWEVIKPYVENKNI